MGLDRVFYITPSDANNLDSDPGVSYFALRALQKVFKEVDYCGSLKRTRSISQLIRKFATSRFKTMKKTLSLHNDVNAKGYARQLQPKLLGENYDLIFSLSTITIADLQTELPIFLYTDATLKNVEDYYPDFTGIDPKSMKAGHALERRALAKCKHIFYTSDWARESAIRDYGVLAEKTSVVTRGANFIGAPDEASVEKWVQARPQDEIRLLFAGVNYKRKGGDIAVEAAQELINRGLKTKLTFVGCNMPPDVEALPFVERIGFLSKQKPDEEALLRKLFEESHFFILPTRAECAAIVFLEASSFGTPNLASDTGGVSTYVINGVTGQTMPFESRGNAYADVIQELLVDRKAYEGLCLKAYRKYRADFNWDAVAKTIHDTIERTLTSK